MEAVEAIKNKAQERYGPNPEVVAVDTNDRPVYKYGDARRMQALSKSQSEFSTTRTTSSALASPRPKSLAAIGEVINFETGKQSSDLWNRVRWSAVPAHDASSVVFRRVRDKKTKHS